MNKFHQRVFLLTIWCMLTVPMNASGDSTGLEANNSHYVHLCINVEGEVGGDPLDKADVQAKVEFLLRSAGIEFKVIPWVDFEETIQVKVQTVSNSFNVSIRFWRGVNYTVNGKNNLVYAPVYLDGVFGTYGGDRHYIINCVGEQIKKFLNEYLRVNGTSKHKPRSKETKQ